VRSLNVPAVEVLEQLGPAQFASMLRRGGLRLQFPRGAEPNLSVILGGAGTTLESLVGAYSALARKGLAGQPRFVPDAPLEERLMMSEGAAYIVRGILESGGPMGQAMEGRAAYHGFAWKTGTSFGFRDAWAVGVSDHYTIGVWVGRPDGTPNPGFFGANVAAPLLADMFFALPDGLDTAPRSLPASVTEERICWPLGVRLTETREPLCAKQRAAWLLEGVAPPTFPDGMASGGPTYFYDVDQRTRLRVAPGCARHETIRVEAARWPTLLEPWLDAALPPAWAPECAGLFHPAERIAITGLSNGAVLHPAHGRQMPRASVSIHGSREDVNWMVNGRLI
jgi:penicillin-binding protein 1C